MLERDRRIAFSKTLLRAGFAAAAVDHIGMPDVFLEKPQLLVDERAVGVELGGVCAALISVVEFEEDVKAIAPGQSIVFYSGDEVLGGGMIALSGER